MDVTVAAAKGLPEKAYLSLRAGDVRKQIQYRPGECFSFEGKQTPRQLVVDVFEKVGSAQVSVADLSSCSSGSVVQLQGRDGNIVLDMQAKVRNESRKPRVSRHQAALDAQAYLEAHSVQRLLQGMVRELLTSRPADPFAFMTSYIEATEATNHVEEGCLERRESIELLPDWAAMPGRGHKDYPGWSSDGSQPLPELSRHHNVLAAVLLRHPELYEQFKDVRTPSGSTLAQCIKPGIDNRGHKIVRTLGLMAADEACYQTFQPLFDAVMSQWQEVVKEEVQISSAPELEAMVHPDPQGKVVLSVQVIMSRNVRGMRMVPSAGLEDKVEVERLLVDAMLGAEPLRGGDYHPLRGSQSYASKPWMSVEMEQQLKAEGKLLQEPQSGLHLSGGLGKHWPQARGVFTGGGIVAWINQADHLKLSYQRADGLVQQAVESTLQVEQAISRQLEVKGYAFSSGDLGYITFCPTNVGSAMQASARLLLPRLAGDEAKLKAMCRQLGLYPSRRRELSDNGERKPIWEVSVARGPEMSAAGMAAALAFGCRRLVEEELQEVDLTSKRQKTCHSVEFPRDRCLDVMPDVSERHSLAAEVFRQDPGIYHRMKERSTPLGVGFAACVKTCFDHVGYPLLRPVGAVAGDAACYETFREFFDAIIRLRHPDSGGGHRSNMEVSKMRDIPKEVAGDRVAFARCRVSRNLRGQRMLPAAAAAERRSLEATVVQVLCSLSGTMEGEYFPLAGSNSYVPKPGGMSVEEEQRLQDEGLLFEEPDAPVLVSSGYALDWPDARGVFVTRGRDLAVNVNELDHLCVHSVEKSGALRATCGRVFEALKAMEAGLQAVGAGFAWDERLGYLGSDPSLLGTCLVASVAIRIPLLSTKPEFQSLRQQLKPKAQLCPTDLGLQQGVWEVQNVLRLGSSEVEQVNCVVEACCALLDLEARLERGGEELSGLAQTMNLDLARVAEAVPGTGDAEYPGFPADACPAEAPDLSRHQSLMAEILSADPFIYGDLKDLRTPLDVSLARCIKPGVDTAGHSFFKMIGAMAGDEHCYEVFAKLFDPIIERHRAHRQPAAVEKLPSATSSAAVSVQVSLERNLSGFRFTPAMTLPERLQVEELLCGALATLPDAGDYVALSSTATEALRSERLLFEAPDAPWILASGRARHWPQARGVFRSKSKEIAAWINDENHLRLIVRGGDLRAAVDLLEEANEALESGLKMKGHSFARSDRLGFLTTCPSDLGTGFRAKMRIALPQLGQELEFNKISRALRLQAKRVLQSEGMWDISLSFKPQTVEMQVQSLSAAADYLNALERRLESGEPVDLDSEAALLN